MAATVAIPVEVPTRSQTPPPSPHLTLNTTFHGSPAPIPNKHIPYCSPGPVPPAHGLPSPPASPPSKTSTPQISSILYPPTAYAKISESPDVYAISAGKLAEALQHISSSPLPDPSRVFPWLHGLHAQNQLQLSFFTRFAKKSPHDVPRCIRGVTVVKAGGNLNFAKLKGAISPEELLLPAEKCRDGHAEHCEGGPCFADVDPIMGFSIRNFQIQTCKVATVSDIVVYGDDMTPRAEVESLAEVLSLAQGTWRKKVDPTGSREDTFHTFVVTDSFETFENDHPELVASNSDGMLTGHVLDFFHQERLEMCTLSAPSEIARNVYLGPTPDPAIFGMKTNSDAEPHFAILVEASDYARLPEQQTLDEIEKYLDTHVSDRAMAQVEFPSSGSIGIPNGTGAEADKLLAMCHWMHKVANTDNDDDSMDVDMDVEQQDQAKGKKTKVPRKILIHCTDGYTETSLLGLAYYMFAERVPAHQAWVSLHREKMRNFFAYQADKNLLEHLEQRIMQESPVSTPRPKLAKQPSWMKRMDGSLPSRILPHLYLGNLNHASNPGLLRQLGIKNVLSVGEPIRWNANPASLEEDPADWPAKNFLFIDGVQDNGIDPLTMEFDKCLDFIGNARAEGKATLVHCRVGVSRSATICIAEVMRELGISFPRAYCFVRARRLNVIIQPHLRFAYELLKWEELQCEKRSLPLKRELEFANIAREIALMNKPYCRE